MAFFPLLGQPAAAAARPRGSFVVAAFAVAFGLVAFLHQLAFALAALVAAFLAGFADGHPAALVLVAVGGGVLAMLGVLLLGVHRTLP
jgi:hypothetical protein